MAATSGVAAINTPTTYTVQKENYIPPRALAQRKSHAGVESPKHSQPKVMPFRFGTCRVYGFAINGKFTWDERLGRCSSPFLRM